MFLFESKQDKEIRLQVQKNMEICLSNPKKYNQAKEVLITHVQESNQKIIGMIVDNIKATIKNQDLQPIIKYQAILLLKDLMLTYNKALGKYVVKKILKRLVIFAKHALGSNYNRQERGKDIFGQVNKDQQVYAIQFFNTLLTALEDWGNNWPKTEDGPHLDFKRQYFQLLINEVQFPQQIPKQEAAQKKNLKSSVLDKVQIKPPFSQFYSSMTQSVLLMQQLIRDGSLQQLGTIKEAISLIEKEIQKNNAYEIIDNCEDDQIKFQNLYTFVQKILKDLKILNKKPEQFKLFQHKYLKLTQRLLGVLENTSTGNKEKELSVDMMQKIAAPSSQYKVLFDSD